MSGASAALQVVDPRHGGLPPSSPLLVPPVAAVALVAPPPGPDYLVLELQLQWYALRIYRRHLFSWITGDDGALLRVSGVLENFACSPEYPECLYSSECVFI
jgi:hypothetical protein